MSGETPQASEPRDGTLTFRVGILVAILGIAHYASVLWMGFSLVVPWYVPTFGAVGGLVMAYGAWPGGLLRRVAATTTVLASAGGFAFLALATRVPNYQGPSVGEPMTEFASRDASGRPVSRVDLLPGREGNGATLTALVLYRGAW